MERLNLRLVLLPLLPEQARLALHLLLFFFPCHRLVARHLVRVHFVPSVCVLWLCCSTQARVDIMARFAISWVRSFCMIPSVAFTSSSSCAIFSTKSCAVMAASPSISTPSSGSCLSIWRLPCTPARQ